MRAPASRQARATGARLVSTETITFFAASPSTTGNTRRSSAATGVGGEPGRVDSPPTPKKGAPSETKRRPSTMACVLSRRSPPSEKESGVTLTIAITRGRSRAMPPKLAIKRPLLDAGLRLGIGAGRGATARHRGAAAAIGTGACAAGIIAHDGLAAHDLPDLVVAQRLVLQQRLGNEVQVVEILGQDDPGLSLSLLDQAAALLVGDLRGRRRSRP